MFMQRDGMPGTGIEDPILIFRNVRQRLRQLAVVAILSGAAVLPAGAQSLTLTKEVAPTEMHPGDVGVYTIKVKNTGAAAATNVMVSDSVPAGLIVTDTEPDATPPSIGNLDYSWDFASLAAGAEEVISVSFVVSSSAIVIDKEDKLDATLMNAAHASADGGLQADSNAVDLHLTFAAGPFIMCPGDVEITEGCPTSFPEQTYGIAMAVDPCDPNPTVTFVDSAMVGAGPGCSEFTRTWTAKNLSGCMSTCVQKFTIKSAAAPVITGSPQGRDLGCNPEETDFPSCDSLKDQLVVAPDACGGLITKTCEQIIPDTGECLKTRTYRLTATNACGKSASVNVEFTYTDDEVPAEITLIPGTSPLPCNATTAEINAALGTASATDNCDTDVTIVPSDGDIQTVDSCTRSLTRTFTATDNCGKSAQKSTTVQWRVDGVKPTINASGTVPNESNLGCNPSASEIDTALGTATADDNCGVGAPTPATGAITPHEGCILKQTRTWNVTDNCGNQADPVSRTIFWTVDLQNPTITAMGSEENGAHIGCNPSPLVIEAALGFASADDNCGVGDPTATTDPIVPGTGCNVSQTRRWNVADNCGRPAAEVTRTIHWKVDVTPPVITPMGNDDALPCNPSAEQIEAALGSATAQDNCDGALTPIATDDEEVINGCVHSITRRWNVSDTCLNAAAEKTRTATWTEDEVDPTFTNPPQDVTVQCNGTIPAPANVTATDNCDTAVTVTPVPEVESPKDECTGNYTIARKWIAEDNCGNTAEHTQVITVLGCKGTISGFVYEDNNDDGIKDAGEAGIGNVTVTLTGTDCAGNAVNTNTMTANDGSYSFPNLMKGTYKLTETQPVGYNDGLDAKENVPIVGSRTMDMITDIALPIGGNSPNNNFGELKPKQCYGCPESNLVSSFMCVSQDENFIYMKFVQFNNDNSYGDNSVWGGKRRFFKQLVTSDQAQFALTDNQGTVVLQWFQDYLSPSSNAPSGYACLGLEGDGGLVSGPASALMEMTTSMADNLNKLGYAMNGTAMVSLAAPCSGKVDLLVNSPPTLSNTDYTLKCPGSFTGSSNTFGVSGNYESVTGWDFLNSYSAKIKKSDLGIEGAWTGTITPLTQHNSPSKFCPEMYAPVPVDCGDTDVNCP